MTAGPSISGPDLAWRLAVHLRLPGVRFPTGPPMRGVGRVVYCIRLKNGQRLSRSRVRIPHSPPHFNTTDHPQGYFTVSARKGKLLTLPATAKSETGTAQALDLDGEVSPGIKQSNRDVPLEGLALMRIRDDGRCRRSCLVPTHRHCGSLYGEPVMSEEQKPPSPEPPEQSEPSESSQPRLEPPAKSTGRVRDTADRGPAVAERAAAAAASTRRVRNTVGPPNPKPPRPKPPVDEGSRESGS